MSAKQPVLVLQTVKVSVCTFKEQTVLYRLYFYCIRTL